MEPPPAAEDRTPHESNAPDEFLHKLSNQVNQDDVNRMVDIQTHMLLRFEKTNEMLQNFNALSAARYQTVQEDFQRHTDLLLNTKKELDEAFSRIRSLKARLSQSHPAAFKAIANTCSIVHEDDSGGTPQHDNNSEVSTQENDELSESAAKPDNVTTDDSATS